MEHPLPDPVQKRLEQFKAYMVGHRVLTEIDEMLTQYIWEPGGFAHVLLYGPTGVGKSTVIYQIAQRLGKGADNGGKGIQPVVLVETPAPFSIAEWYTNVLIALDERIIEERVYRDIQTARSTPGRASKSADEAPALRRAVEAALKTHGVRAILFDEAQHFMGNETTTEIKQKWDWLKSLSNTTGVLHVLAGPYSLLKLRNVSGQASRRGTDIHFPRYHQENEGERQDFQGALYALLEQAWKTITETEPSQETLQPLVDEWPFFYERSLGCIGILKEWLIRSVSQALFVNAKTLDMKQIRQRAPSVAKSEKILLEIMAGEHQLALEETEQHQLRQMLGLTEEIAVSEEALPTPKRRGRKPGTRNPKRDPVGNDS